MPRTAPTALLFELSGCLVDFGARTLPVSLQRLHPEREPPNVMTTPQQALAELLGQSPSVEQLQELELALEQSAGEHAELAPGAAPLLARLKKQDTPWIWLDGLGGEASPRLAQALPAVIDGLTPSAARPWPAPDLCWQALSRLRVDHLEGCVLVSGNPLLLRAGLNAGCWTIGLAASGPLCGLAPGDWQALESKERERLRAQATLELYRLGAHSVVDHLGEIEASLDDIGTRRQKGEKP